MAEVYLIDDNHHFAGFADVSADQFDPSKMTKLAPHYNSPEVYFDFEKNDWVTEPIAAATAEQQTITEITKQNADMETQINQLQSVITTLTTQLANQNGGNK
ncbi:hypothetical protein [Furfurilactobacillus curtus]|uniref:DUF2977 domain-containing protein n=1 Tax=Furfurilactobacillus curtus TaxID=1746200 RepID=A0ABQ5JKD5_9LACO